MRSPRAARLLRAWGPAGAWCAVIFALSSFPVRTGSRLVPGGDGTLHLVEYGVLGFLATRALRLSRPGWGAAGGALLGAALAAAWGVTDEWHQSLVPERAAEWGDLAADAVGAILGAAAFAGASRRGAIGAIPAPSAPSPRIGAPPGP